MQFVKIVIINYYEKFILIMSQRFDPFLKEWVIFAPGRANRPILGKSFQQEEKKTWTCPFCPDAPEGAGEWVVKQLPNRFASLKEDSSLFSDNIKGDFYQESTNYGKCEVILYSQDHNKSFGQLTFENIVALVNLWQERYREIAKFPDLKYAFLFENRGKEIGVSMAHPHGQIYTFSYLPPRIYREFDAVKEFHQQKGKCLGCEVLAQELADGRRIIDQNETFVTFIPFYAHWPFEIHIYPKRHIQSISDCSAQEVQDLAQILKKTVLRYDALRGDGNIMPYVMAQHNAPYNDPQRDLWHFHIEIYTPFRGSDRWKFLAGVELGTNTFINDSSPEVNAETFRKTLD
jgi:UDPglucose--hexose-1-phosphate uridylyltransferase